MVWLDGNPSTLDKSIRRDLELLRMRNFIDPKRFYKANDNGKSAPSRFMLGTVVEAPHEFLSSRLTKSERSSSIFQGALRDDGLRKYVSRVSVDVRRKNAKGWKKSKRSSKSKR